MDRPDEENISFLWNAARKLPHNSAASKLKCYYTNICKQAASAKSIILPERRFGEKSMCKYCLTPWGVGNFKLRVLPKNATRKRMLKIINKSEIDLRLLSPYENQLFVRYVKNNGNKMVLSCLVCHKDTSIVMRKPESLKMKVANETPEMDKLKKKKKKMKDPFAGLNRSAVMSVKNTPSPCLAVEAKKRKKGDKCYSLKTNGCVPVTPLTTVLNKKRKVDNSSLLATPKNILKRVKRLSLGINSPVLPNSPNVANKPNVETEHYIKKLEKSDVLKRMLMNEESKTLNSSSTLKDFLFSVTV